METPVASGVFATLTPANAAAKLVFHRAAEASMAQLMHPAEDGKGYHASFMVVNPVKEYARDVTDSDATSTAPDTATEKYLRELYTIWHGEFVFDLGARDAGSNSAWVAGRGRKGYAHACQFLLPDRSPASLRGCHVRFRLCENTGYLTLAAFSLKAQNIYVDGQTIALSKHAFNKPTAKIGIENLQFDFKHTSYANTKSFLDERDGFVKRMHQASAADTLHMTPTPVPGNVVLGQWTINTALRKGTSGEVYSATNQGSEVVAVKMVERRQRNAPKIKKMRDNLKELTREIKEENCDRIIHLCEVIPAEELEAPLHSLQFELVYFVMSPAVSMTLSEFMPHVNRKTGSLQPARLLRELLEGLHFLHSHSWLHGDIKPDNIGISKTHAIILDVDTIVSLPPNQTLSPTPGCGGTISYLAPKREMLEYDHAVDVWAAGVVGHQLIYGYHPFQLATNPWRPGQEHYVPWFKERYRVCCERLSSDNIPVAGLVVEMMRHQWDGVTGKIRVTAAEALVHPFWNCLEEVDLHGPEMKKRKQ